MERTQCLYEHLVDYNLSESGVSPLRIEELIDGAINPSDLLSTRLGYPWAGGSPELREHIAAWYGCDPEQIRVTNGSSEANFMEFWGLLEKGDRAAIMLPNYLQTWGLARHFTGRADAFRLVRVKAGGRERWALDTDSLDRAVSKRTKVILVTNPNNPTGAILTEEEMEAVVRAARRAGAWIVADEVYRGAELAGDALTPTFLGRYSKVLVTSGLSKAFGLPGLRIGWIAGPPRMVARLESYHDYLTLTPTTISDRLARIAMEPSRRDRLIRRTRGIVRSQLPRLAEWVDGMGSLAMVAPEGGAIATISYRQGITSTRLFERLREEKSVLITPGAHFGLNGKYFRVGYGYDIEHTLKGLARITELFEELA
jgi:hypothetical protein